MAGGKYIVATAENPFQINIRNILNPYGYTFLANCGDSISLIRLIRSYSPDFVIVDANLKIGGDIGNTLETIDDDMLCACIIVGDLKDMEVNNLLDNSKIISYCPKPLNKEILLHTVEMAGISFKRIYGLTRKLKEMTENYETRKVVDRAKWILMKRDNISEEEAYEKMRKKSMNTRESMKTIAEAIILSSDISR